MSSKAKEVDFILLLFTMPAIARIGRGHNGGHVHLPKHRVRYTFLEKQLCTRLGDYFCTVFRLDLAERCHL